MKHGILQSRNSEPDPEYSIRIPGMTEKSTSKLLPTPFPPSHTRTRKHINIQKGHVVMMFALKSSHGGIFFFISRLELGDELLIRKLNK